jgi:hypothetical protein
MVFSGLPTLVVDDVAESGEAGGVSAVWRACMTVCPPRVIGLDDFALRRRQRVPRRRGRRTALLGCRLVREDRHSSRRVAKKHALTDQYDVSGSIAAGGSSGTRPGNAIRLHRHVQGRHSRRHVHEVLPAFLPPATAASEGQTALAPGVRAGQVGCPCRSAGRPRTQPDPVRTEGLKSERSVSCPALGQVQGRALPLWVPKTSSMACDVQVFAIGR